MAWILDVRTLPPPELIHDPKIRDEHAQCIELEVFYFLRYFIILYFKIDMETLVP